MRAEWPGTLGPFQRARVFREARKTKPGAGVLPGQEAARLLRNDPGWVTHLGEDLT